MLPHREDRSKSNRGPSRETEAVGLLRLHPAATVRGRRGGRDAGIVLVIVIVCLSVAAAILATFVTMAVVGRDALRAEDRALQAEWLAESAIERAAARLMVNREYAGESWTVDAKEMDRQEGGVAVIRIEPVADQPNGRRVCVQADYPDDPVYRCRRMKEVIVELPKPPEAAPPQAAPAPEPSAPAETKPAEPLKPAESPAESSSAKPTARSAETPAGEPKPAVATETPNQEFKSSQGDQ